MDKVVDIKTGKPLFTDNLRNEIAKGVSPFTDNQDQAVAAANAVEQVLCVALVGAARNLAAKVASKIFDKIADSSDGGK